MTPLRSKARIGSTNVRAYCEGLLLTRADDFVSHMHHA